jgi:ribosome-associated translation inhibitor RaiA
MASYDYYGYESVSAETIINGHKMSMTYELRMDVAERNEETQEWQLRDVPKAYIAVTMELMPSKEKSNSTVTLRERYDIEFLAEDYYERIDEAIGYFNQVIEHMPLPKISFDFWKYVSSAAPAFEACAKAFKKLSWVSNPE